MAIRRRHNESRSNLLGLLLSGADRFPHRGRTGPHRCLGGLVRPPAHGHHPDALLQFAGQLLASGRSLLHLCGRGHEPGGITETLITFAAKITRFVAGGAAYANILASVLFAGISGTAIADTAALGKIFINGMPKQGYTKEFSAAVTVASSMIGPIIPPSVIMIVYASVAQVSIIKLFVAGIVPGLMLGGACAVIVLITAMTKGLPKGEIKAVDKSDKQLVFETALVFSIPMFIVFGTLSGVFTATEAGGIACVYALVIGRFVLKTLSGRSVLACMRASMRTTASLYLVIAGASVLSYILTVTGAISSVRSLTVLFSDSQTIFLFFVLGILLIAGFFLEPGVQVLLLAPIFLPISRGLGIDEMQFAMVFLLSGTMSLMTPPVGICLFVAAQIGEISIGRMFWAILPFLAAQIVAISFLIIWAGSRHVPAQPGQN